MRPSKGGTLAPSSRSKPLHERVWLAATNGRTWIETMRVWFACTLSQYVCVCVLVSGLRLSRVIPLRSPLFLLVRCLCIRWSTCILLTHTPNHRMLPRTRNGRLSAARNFRGVGWGCKICVSKVRLVPVRWVVVQPKRLEGKHSNDGSSRIDLCYPGGLLVE